MQLMELLMGLSEAAPLPVAGEAAQSDPKLAAAFQDQILALLRESPEDESSEAPLEPPLEDPRADRETATPYALEVALEADAEAAPTLAAELLAARTARQQPPDADAQARTPRTEDADPARILPAALRSGPDAAPSPDPAPVRPPASTGPTGIPTLAPLEAGATPNPAPTATLAAATVVPAEPQAATSPTLTQPGDAAEPILPTAMAENGTDANAEGDSRSRDGLQDRPAPVDPGRSFDSPPSVESQRSTAPARSPEPDAALAPTGSPAPAAEARESQATVAPATAVPDAAPLASEVTPGDRAAPLVPPTPTSPAASPAEAAPRPAAGAPSEAVPLHVEWLAARGGGQARLRLHPPELGEIQLSVTVRGNDVDVTVRALEAAAGQAIVASRDALLDGLAGRELRMDQLDVHYPGSDDGPRHEAEGRDPRQQDPRAPGDGAGREEEEPAELHPALRENRMATAPDAIDIRV